MKCRTFPQNPRTRGKSLHEAQHAEGLKVSRERERKRKRERQREREIDRDRNRENSELRTLLHKD